MLREKAEECSYEIDLRHKESLSLIRASFDLIKSDVALFAAQSEIGGPTEQQNEGTKVHVSVAGYDVIAIRRLANSLKD